MLCSSPFLLLPPVIAAVAMSGSTLTAALRPLVPMTVNRDSLLNGLQHIQDYGTAAVCCHTCMRSATHLSAYLYHDRIVSSVVRIMHSGALHLLSVSRPGAFVKGAVTWRMFIVTATQKWTGARHLDCTCFVEGGTVCHVHNAAVQALVRVHFLVDLLGMGRHHQQIACKHAAVCHQTVMWQVACRAGSSNSARAAHQCCHVHD